ncbi:hypothetical protein VTN00DRAFT_5072 [Thermoascus crustaceus]|uniref:uncharacterized protein n=1 Tax=Thermoascus crustaceus TaxID=5088 RepID=UPI003744A8CF
MSSAADNSEFKTIRVVKLHLTLGAEITGVDFLEPIPDEIFQEVLAVVAKTGLDDRGHVEFSRKFGELDDIKPYVTKYRKLRYDYYELFDAGNVDEKGNFLDPESLRAMYNKGNCLFHNPRRASYSILRAVVLPPPEAGGNTDFADSRTAFADLLEDLRRELVEKDYVVAHSLHHSRKTAAPDYFKHLNPTAFKMHKHRLVELHEPFGRISVYMGAHAHHIDGLSPDNTAELLKRLMEHATQEKYIISVTWKDPGDMVMWDNTAAMHRAGVFTGKHPRDLRRTTVHDASS